MVMGADGPGAWQHSRRYSQGRFSCSLQRLTQAQLLWHFLDLLCFLYCQQSALNMGITMQITVWIKTFAKTAKKEERENGKRILETGQTKDRADKEESWGSCKRNIEDVIKITKKPREQPRRNGKYCRDQGEKNPTIVTTFLVHSYFHFYFKRFHLILLKIPRYIHIYDKLCGLTKLPGC